MKRSSLIFPDYKARNLWLLLAGLKVGQTRFLRRQYRISGEWFHLAAVMLEGDLLVVACDDKPRSGLKYYGLRWGIETLFGNTKTRGFHLEDTHLVDPKKLGMLMGLVSLGALWALRVGEWLEKITNVMRRKSHGRFEATMPEGAFYGQERSLFRVGLDYLRGMIFDGELENREHRFVFRVLTCT